MQRDLPELPALAAVMAPWDAFVAEVRDDVVARWSVEGRATESAHARLAAAVAHAFRFETWRSLARNEGRGDAAAADLMVNVAHAAAPAPAPD